MSAISVARRDDRPSRGESSIASLVIDVAIPLAIYYALHDGLGLSLGTVIWGAVLLVDCCARVVCAYTMPVTELAWLSTAITVGSISFAAIASGAAYGERIQRALDAELA